jgi:Golgi phosphoprotein 3
MPTNQRLLLYEEIMLLALRDEKGTIGSGTMYQIALGGAILSELLLEKRIEVDVSKKRKLVDLVDSKPIGDPLVDECLEKIKNAKRRATLQTWVTRFANVKKLKHRAAAQLCKRRILRADEDKVLLVFTRKIYPEINPKPERELIERLRKAIFTDIKSLDPRTVVLVSLAKNCDLLRIPFDKRKLKERKKRIEGIVNGEMTGEAAKAAMEAMQAAIFVCCIMPAVLASTTTS